MGINDSPSMSQVATEFGGSAPHSLSEYYGLQFSDGSYAPSSGTISLSDFRNKSSDTTAPVITLSGANPYLVPEAGSFSDPGATADGGETVSINTSNLNSIQTSGGNGDVVYSAADAAGNIGYSIRTVKYLVREPVSGYQYRITSPRTYYAYPVHCPGHRIFWNDIQVYNSTSAPSFPITINGWTYYMGSYIATAPGILCGLPPGPDGFDAHELYRVGYL